MRPSISSSVTSARARALRQGQAYPSTQRSVGSAAASLHSADGAPIPPHSTSSRAASLLPANPFPYYQPFTTQPYNLTPSRIGSLTSALVDDTDLGSIQFIVEFAKKRLPVVDRLKEGEKWYYFHTSTQATICILLYEFASGSGKKCRTFNEKDAITQSVMQLHWTDLAIENFYERNRGRNKYNTVAQQYYYQFSPSANPLTWRGAIIAHENAAGNIIASKDYLQLFLGGVIYDVQINGDWLEIRMTDNKSRSSWYLHAGAVWDRANDIKRDDTLHYRQPLTNTEQEYLFRVSLEEQRLFSTSQWLNHVADEFRKTYRIGL